MLIQMNSSTDALQDINKQVAYVWAAYTAETSVEKALYDIKSNDVDSIKIFQEKRALWTTKNLEESFLNYTADAGYFNRSYNNATQHEIKLWDVDYGDIVFEEVQPEDNFNILEINYNRDNADADLIVNILQYPNSNNSYSRCTFDRYLGSQCSHMTKTVINTKAEQWTMWTPLMATFPTWDPPYKDKLKIENFNTDNFNYRISFSTLLWDKTSMEYFVTNSWNRREIVNNYIEIDSIWTAVWSNSRIKLQKKIIQSVQPVSKYVIFSDSTIKK